VIPRTLTYYGRSIIDIDECHLQTYVTRGIVAGMEHRLECQRCGKTHEPGTYRMGCQDCLELGTAGRLEVVPDFGSVDLSTLPFEDDDERPMDMWRYRELLPLLPDDPVTMGEGWTPLHETSNISATADVYLKNETVNPTWSFKDRLNSLLLSNAVASLGENHIATSSTGNHSASTAAYARRAGADEVVVLVPPETERPLRAQIRAYGAKVAVTDYDSRRALLASLAECGWFPTVSVSKEYISQPYGYEGYKTVAFELVEQLAIPPDTVVAAVGAGDGLYGIWKGFRELRELGVIDRTPRMVGVQPAERPSPRRRSTTAVTRSTQPLARCPSQPRRAATQPATTHSGRSANPTAPLLASSERTCVRGCALPAERGRPRTCERPHRRRYRTGGRRRGRNSR
jgi:threonine synthase